MYMYMYVHVHVYMYAYYMYVYITMHTVLRITIFFFVILKKKQQTHRTSKLSKHITPHHVQYGFPSIMLMCAVFLREILYQKF